MELTIKVAAEERQYEEVLRDIRDANDLAIRSSRFMISADLNIREKECLLKETEAMNRLAILN